MKLKLIVFSVISVLMMGCASQAVKAPCDYHGHFCGTKTKINNW